MRTRSFLLSSTSTLLAGALLSGAAPGAHGASQRQSWPMFGQNPSNTASTFNEDISTRNVGKLAPLWVATLGGDISARAAVVNGVAYVPDWAGNLWAINTSNGKTLWTHQLADYGLAPGTVSRTSPAVVNGTVYIGTQYNPSGPTGWLLAIDAATGKLVWKVQPDMSNPFPVITASPAVANGIVFVGMTSNEEFVAANPLYPCCSVSGSVVALDAAHGTKLWQTFTAPPGYGGANVWGSNPVVDVKRGTVYVGTGNNYHIPSGDPKYAACIIAGGTQASCLSPEDHADSILALDILTGSIKWSTRLMSWHQPYAEDGSDFWNVGCITSPFTNCPNPAGPDYDFASAPNEITYQTPSGPKTIIGAGQKSGIYYALDPDTGQVLWQTQVGPGSSLGGIEWGSASDGTRIYVAIANLFGIPYAAGNAGSWAALDPATGAILWRRADPNGTIDLGPLAVANGIVYAPSMAGGPQVSSMFALDAASGSVLWRYAPGSSVIAGASIVNGTVFWGSGYTHLPIPGFTGNNKFFAFTVNGN
jgi:polyvinyl alcohol dehydrogenase (cytochrome)